MHFFKRYLKDIFDVDKYNVILTMLHDKIVSK